MESKLFKQIYRIRLREISNSIDPNSYEAYYEKDPGDEDEDVIIEDEINGKNVIFTWHRKKSNDNLIDNGSGKGFSFYLARHVFRDYYRVPGPAADPKNICDIGIIPGDNKVMVVVDSRIEKNKIRIVSAYYVNSNSQWANVYWVNRERKTLFESMNYYQEDEEKVEERRKIIERWRRIHN